MKGPEPKGWGVRLFKQCCHGWGQGGACGNLGLNWGKVLQINPKEGVNGVVGNGWGNTWGG